MKRKYLIKSVTFLCLMLMLAWSMAGCANTAGFVSQQAEVNEPEFTGNTVQEPADEAAGSEETSPVTDAEEPAESAASDDVMAADVEEISINEIGAVAIGQTENAEAGTGCPHCNGVSKL